MAAHSKQLGHGAAQAVGLHTLYTVPSGKVTIVKSIQLYNNGAVANRVIVEAVISGTTVVVAIPHLAAAAAVGETVDLQTWFVLQAGDALKIAPQSAAVDVLASGAELTA